MDQQVLAKTANKNMKRGDGGYDTFNANDFELVKGKTQVRVNVENSGFFVLFDSGKMNHIMLNTVFTRYRCEVTARDVAAFLKSNLQPTNSSNEQNQTLQTKKTQKAQKICTELGFSKGTSEFSNCVSKF
nr:hypothetical protein 11 [Alphaproteobacteria bacterium]